MPDLHLPLDRTAGRLSGQLAAGLRTAIRAGRLAARTKLPSSRELAHDLEVSRGVVVTAYEQLIAEGFLTAQPGDGTRVAALARPDGPPPPSATVWPCEPPAREAVPYDLRPGQPDLAAFPREAWGTAMRSVLRTIPHTELAYPDPIGVPALRAELAGYLGRVRAAHATPEQVAVMDGVAHGLAAIAHLLGAQGERVLAVEDPTSYRQIPTLQAAGLELVRIPVDAEGIDVKALAASEARAVLVTPAHQYPTGVVLSPGRRAELIAWARDVDGLVIEDDYDAEFRYDREPVGCVQGVEPDRVVLAGSVSKSLAPGLRLGWLVVPPSMTERLRQYRSRTDLGSSVLDQHTLAQLISSGAYDRHLRAMRRQYRDRRDVLTGALRAFLPTARVQGVAAGLHLYVELPPGNREDEVVEAAAQLGVAVAEAAPMWSAPHPPALVLGYGRVNSSRLTAAVEILGKVVTPGDDG